MDESTLLYQEAGEPSGDGDQQVVLRLPEGCDTSEGVIMQIEGNKIHIIAKGGEQLAEAPLGQLSMASIIQTDSQDPAHATATAVSSGATTAEVDADLQGEEGEEEGEVELPEEETYEVGKEEVEEEEEEEDVEMGTEEEHDLQAEEEDTDAPESECFVCSAPCRRPAGLLLTRTSGSCTSLAERLATLLPLRLHCSAADGVCGGCQQLIEQADMYHTQLKSVELRVRQLFRLEEKLEEEERLAEREQDAQRQRQERLAQRQEVERRRQLAQQADAERRRRQVQRRMRLADGAEESGEQPSQPEADSGAGGGEARTAAATGPLPPPLPPLPPPRMDDPADEDWTPKKRYVSRRRRQPRRPWSPSDATSAAAHASARSRSETEHSEHDQDPDDLTVVFDASAEETPATATAADGEVPEEAAAADGEPEPEPDISPDPEQKLKPDPIAAEDGSEPQEDDEGCRDPDGVQTTTIEFVSLDQAPAGGLVGGSRTGLLGLGIGRSGHRGPRRRKSWNSVPSFYCRRCDTCFENSNALVEHITTLHRRPWCRLCRGEFESTRELAKHRRLCRSQCSLCGLKPANMAQHIATRHPEHKTGAAAAAAGEGEAAEATGQQEKSEEKPKPRGKPRVWKGRSPSTPATASGNTTTGKNTGTGTSASATAAAGGTSAASEVPPTPTIIEYRDVKSLREQVKHVKTPRFSLKFRRSCPADLAKIKHLSVDTIRVSTVPAATDSVGAGGGGGGGSGGGGSGNASAEGGTTPGDSLAGHVTAMGILRGSSKHGGKAHTCLRCGTRLGSLREQIEHLHTVHRGKSWCRRCMTEFNSKREHLLHRADCRRATCGGTCEQCGKRVRNLRAHLRTHQFSGDKRRKEQAVDEDGRPISASLAGGNCDVCKKYIPHRLRRHIASHVRHPCPICKKLFSREDVIAGHIKRVHMKERPHICNHCGKGFVSLYSMQRHEMIHTNSYRFYCQECGEGFRQKQQLTTHMKHRHGVLEIEFEDVRESAFLGQLSDGTLTTELRFYCQECGSGFHSRRLLTAHMHIKHGVANVVFEDVQLHVAGTIEHMEAVAVAEQEDSQTVVVTSEVDALTEERTAADPPPVHEEPERRQSWWDTDQTGAY